MASMFITFEGTEGSGKSTALAGIAHALRQRGLTVLCTREPGAGDLGASIRQALLFGGQLAPETELFLFLADRAEHTAKMIRPALERGETVLCDRYGDSTVAYQGHARGLSVERLRELNSMATRALRPDLTLLFDLEPSLGLARLAEKDRMDAEPIAFHEKVRAGFHEEMRLDPGRWVLMDAAQEPGEVLSRALEAVVSRLENR